MKKVLLLFCAVMNLCIFCNTASVAEVNETTDTEIVYHVKAGSYGGDGTSEETAFSTIEQAKEAVRNQLSNKNNINKNITVLIHAGTYRINKSIDFNKDDGGGENQVVLYKAAGDGEVILSGAVELDLKNFKEIENSSVKKRIPLSARDSVGQLDLSKEGLSKQDVELIYSRGDWGRPYGVYLNNKRQKIARWPNSGYKIFSKIVSSTSSGQGPTIFEYEDTEIDSWLKAKDAYIEGFFRYDWSGCWAPISMIDAENRQITISETGTYGVPNAGGRWAVTNLLEAIDVPGEYYIDKDSMMLYYYPIYPLNKSEDKLEFSVLREPIITLSSDVKNICFEGLIFEKCYGDAIKIVDLSDNIKFRNCIIRNIAGNGIIIRGRDITVENCDIYNIGLTGIYVQDAGKYGDSELLKKSNTRIENNNIFNVSQNSGSNSVAAIIINAGIGVVIENNTLHGSVNGLIRYSGIMHTIRRNEIYNAMRQAADAGAIYAGRSLIQYGTVIEENYFHDFGSLSELETSFGTSGIFLDDAHSGNTIRNNIFKGSKSSSYAGVHIGSGRDNIVENNIFIDGRKGLGADDRSKSYTPESDMYKELINSKALTGLYLKQFPQMSVAIKEIEADGYIYPRHNEFKNNLHINTILDIADIYYQYSDVDNNPQLTDYSALVDYDNDDFRIKKSIMNEYNIDTTINENFDLGEIGVQGREKKTPAEFFKAYPRNGDINVSTQNLSIVWEASDFADEYEYIVATDENLDNIIAEGKTENTSVEIPDIENDTIYYWQVYAKSIGYKNEVSKVSYGDVYCFKTSTTDILNKKSLNERIIKAEKLVNSIKEGSNVGEYKIGTINTLKEEIEKAKNTAEMVVGKQTTIDASRRQLKNAYDLARSNYNIGYRTISVDENLWHDSNGDNKAQLENGRLFFSSDIGTGLLYYRDMIEDYNILCFKAENISDSGWFGFTVRLSENNAQNSYSSGMNSYLVVVKQDVFELQGRSRMGDKTTMMKTVPNNGIFPFNKECEVKFGAVPENGATRIIFEVDGQTIFNYLDNDNPITDSGYFAITPIKGIYISPSDNVPLGLFEPVNEQIEDIHTENIIDKELEIVDSSYTGVLNNKAVLLETGKKYTMKSGDYSYVVDTSGGQINVVRNKNNQVVAIKKNLNDNKIVLKILSGEHGNRLIAKQENIILFDVYDPVEMNKLKFVE